MKPYPFASLNHFTFPLAIARCLQRSESILHFVVLGTPLDVRRLYRNSLNFCQEIDGSSDEWRAARGRQPDTASRLLRTPMGSYVRAVPKENLIGQTIAGYTLRNEVGEGGTSDRKSTRLNSSH